MTWSGLSVGHRFWCKKMLLLTVPDMGINVSGSTPPPSPTLLHRHQCPSTPHSTFCHGCFHISISNPLLVTSSDNTGVTGYKDLRTWLSRLHIWFNPILQHRSDSFDHYSILPPANDAAGNNSAQSPAECTTQAPGFDTT